MGSALEAAPPHSPPKSPSSTWQELRRNLTAALGVEMLISSPPPHSRFQTIGSRHEVDAHSDIPVVEIAGFLSRGPGPSHSKTSPRSWTCLPMGTLASSRMGPAQDWLLWASDSAL